MDPFGYHQQAEPEKADGLSLEHGFLPNGRTPGQYGTHSDTLSVPSV